MFTSITAVELGSMSANKRVDPSTALLLGHLSLFCELLFLSLK